MRQGLLRKSIAGLAFVFMAWAGVRAQVTSRGTVTGTVTDASGALVANATVILTEPATELRRRTTTTSARIERFDPGELGTYVVQVQRLGCRTRRKGRVES